MTSPLSSLWHRAEITVNLLRFGKNVKLFDLGPMLKVSRPGKTLNLLSQLSSD